MAGTGPIGGVSPMAATAAGPMATGAGVPGGYQGLGGILSWLAAGGINQGAYDNMGVGANGNTIGGIHYGVGGSHGALRGLSPQAVAWMQSNLMQANAPAMQSLTGADGAALTGHDLLMANLHNSLAKLAPTTYGLKSGDEGLTAGDLAGLFGTALGGVGGANPYSQGYDANGWVQIHDNHPNYDRFHNSHPGNNQSYKSWLKAHPKAK